MFDATLVELFDRASGGLYESPESLLLSTDVFSSSKHLF